MPEAITLTRLPNGLTVHLKEIHTAPLISHWVWYRVGSRDETPGITGISHWVEHMQFKGTPAFPPSVLDKAISREGGMWNAFTYLDWTTYFETMPADKIDLGLRLEADRMVNSLFKPEEVESERTVIISEREGHENSPGWRLSEEVRALAFRVHPYHHMVIGDKPDLETITRDQLYQHYRTYYVPNNAIVVAAGDFEPTSLLARIEELFGPLPAGAPVPTFQRVEPPQAGERRVHLTGPDPTAFLQMAYHTPDVSHTDYVPLVMLDILLDGAAPQHRATRLYRALVQTELATSVSSSQGSNLDPFLFYLSATVREGCAIEAVEAALLQAVERVQNDGVEERELARGIKQMRAGAAYAVETVTGQASRLGTAESLGDYRLFDTLVDRLQEVTPADVRRVAQTYLVAKNRTVGWYTPDKP